MAVRKINSTNSRNEQSLAECDLSFAVSMIGGRWKLQILSLLDQQKLRFSDMKKEFPLITERMLSLQLQALEKDGLIRREVFAAVPPRVEYQLSEMAKELIPILDQLSEWGNRKRKQDTLQPGN